MQHRPDLFEVCVKQIVESVKLSNWLKLLIDGGANFICEFTDLHVKHDQIVYLDLLACGLLVVRRQLIV
jgi:hypothetical protein